MTVSTLLMPMLEIPKEWQTWKWPPIYIHLVFDSSAECEWVLDFISKSIVNSNVSHFRGDILSKHYLSCLFNIKSKHIGICKRML